MITIDELIRQALMARHSSKLKGETIVHLCEKEREYIPIKSTKLESDEDGAVFLIKI